LTRAGKEAEIIPPDPIEQTQALMKAFNMTALSALDGHHKATVDGVLATISENLEKLMVIS
jgi:hypothetical protein